MVLVLLFDKKTKSVTKPNKNSFIEFILFCAFQIIKKIDVETGFHTFYIHFDTYTKAMNYYDLPSMGKWSSMVLILSFDKKTKSVFEQHKNVPIDFVCIVCV